MAESLFVPAPSAVVAASKLIGWVHTNADGTILAQTLDVSLPAPVGGLYIYTLGLGLPALAAMSAQEDLGNGSFGQHGFCTVQLFGLEGRVQTLSAVGALAARAHFVYFYSL